ncbi:MAG: hypothetical protein ABT940_08595 [Alphaproteobacteria bacterium]
MSNLVTFSLENATASTEQVRFTVLNGTGTFFLKNSDPTSITGTFTFQQMSLQSHALAFQVSAQTQFNGTVNVQIQPAGGGVMPQVEVVNVSADTVNVSWPTSTGTVTQAMTPGTPLTLSDFTTD